MSEHGKHKNIFDVAIISSPRADNVAVVYVPLLAGTIVKNGAETIEIQTAIDCGNRFALRDIPEGEYVRQYGAPFGCSRGIIKGGLVSAEVVENTLPVICENDFVEPAVTECESAYVDRTFQGYLRANGEVGTRNYYIVLPTSMCISEIAIQVAKESELNLDLSRNFPQVDGIVSLAHTEGCGCDATKQIDRTLRVLRAYITHPNVGGCLVMDLGCEQTNRSRLEAYLADDLLHLDKPIDWITVQEIGGTRPAIVKAKELVQQRVTEINRVTRQTCPLASLVVGTQCGASDSFSGITANPLIGNVVDKVIRFGGKAILSEITEMVGAFSFFFSRFRTLTLAHKFNSFLNGYIDLAERLDLSIDGNVVPANKKGGLLNQYIKSLGAIMKGGTMPIEDVVEYSERSQKKGLAIMDGPGGDPESVTGIVGGGANVVLFSTGKGTITGNAICPIVKISSNTETFNKLKQDIDFDAGRIISEANSTLEIVGDSLLEKVVAVASGQRTWAEKWGQRQFQIWTAGKLSL